MSGVSFMGAGFLASRGGRNFGHGGSSNCASGGNSLFICCSGRCHCGIGGCFYLLTITYD